MLNALRMMGSSNFNAVSNTMTGTIGSGYVATMGIGVHQASSSGAGATTFAGLPGYGGTGMMGSYLLHPVSNNSAPVAGSAHPPVIASDLHQTMADIMRDLLGGNSSSTDAGAQLGIQNMLEVMDDIQLVGLAHMGQLFSPIVP